MYGDRIQFNTNASYCEEFGLFGGSVPGIYLNEVASKTNHPLMPSIYSFLSGTVWGGMITLAPILIPTKIQKSVTDFKQAMYGRGQLKADDLAPKLAFLVNGDTIGIFRSVKPNYPVSSIGLVYSDQDHRFRTSIIPGGHETVTMVEYGLPEYIVVAFGENLAKQVNEEVLLETQTCFTGRKDNYDWGKVLSRFLANSYDGEVQDPNSFVFIIRLLLRGRDESPWLRTMSRSFTAMRHNQ